MSTLKFRTEMELSATTGTHSVKWRTTEMVCPFVTDEVSHNIPKSLYGPPFGSGLHSSLFLIGRGDKIICTFGSESLKSTSPTPVCRPLR